MNQLFKTIGLAIGFSIFSLAGYAQQNVSIGLETGPSISSLRGNALANETNSALHFSSAISIQYAITDVFSLRTAIGYERKGAKSFVEITSSTADPVGETTIYTNLDYLTVPVLARFTTHAGKVNLFFNAGPHAAFLLKSVSGIKEFQSMPAESYDNTSSSKRLDLGLSTGLGLSLPIGEKVALSFEVRNNLGLINNNTVKNNSINFLFGISRKVGK